MITVFTVTIGGRSFYLKKSIQSLRNSIIDIPIKHVVMFNGTTIDDDIINNKEDFPSNYTLEIVQNSRTVSIGEALNILKDKIEGELVMKMDDDCLIHSDNFFRHVIEIHKLIPHSTFSPFPVGLIGNLGGVKSDDRKVVYSEDIDTYYTLRKVNHVGGFARICPSKYAKSITFMGNGHDEDGQFSSKYNRFGMYYLENALVVEHMESTLGQHARYGNEYWKGRF